MIRFLCLFLSVLLFSSSFSQAQTREEKVRQDRAKVEAEGFWIYNDFDRGLREAKQTGKPLIVILRCIPCEECVKLDEDLMEQDPHLKPLLDKYVRVRIVGTNGLDLSLFQYDYDQSFAVFLMNADKTIYGRFGTRSHHTLWSEDVSIAGLAKAMDAALELHENYPANRKLFAAKTGPKPKYKAPEKYPSLRNKYSSELDYKGQVVKSCIHCHQIGDAQRELFRSAGKPLPVDVLFQYPHPKILGLILDPTETAVVKEVASGSAAEQAGFQPEDRIVTLEGQPMLSIADVQWVLHHTDDAKSLKAEVLRDGEQKQVTLPLEKGWRQTDDLSWRVSSWPLRRMTTGGLKLEAATEEERAKLKLDDPQQMAIRIQHIGQYGPHAAAKRAGFQKDDILIRYGDRTDLLRETDLLAYGVNNYKPGQQVPVTVLRNGKRKQLKLPMQR